MYINVGTVVPSNEIVLFSMRSASQTIMVIMQRLKFEVTI